MGAATRGETPTLTGESIGEAHRVLEYTQTYPSGNQHMKGHSLLVGSEGNDSKWGECQVSSIVPSYNLSGTPSKEKGPK